MVLMVLWRSGCVAVSVVSCGCERVEVVDGGMKGR